MMLSETTRRNIYDRMVLGFRYGAIADNLGVDRDTIAKVRLDRDLRRSLGWHMDQKHWIVIREKNAPCPCGCHGSHPHHYWRYPRRVLLRSKTRGVVQLPWMPSGIAVPVKLVQVGLFEAARSEWRLTYQKRDSPPITPQVQP